ncbi:uncharacterized protein [Palaemon carinicauda]|uniref:uncharacterized protein n=1 Tax=Palaemon carinicauda TaxID=392227 RepID=UPI0035B5C2B5
MLPSVVCDWKLKNCNKSALMKHKASSKHTRNLDAKKNTLNIKQFFKRSDAELPQDKVAKAEMYLTGYMAEHGVPSAQADHLVDVIKKMFPVCETARNMKMKKTKASYMLQDGIAWEERRVVAKFCRENYFSLIIDESTDVSVSQVLAVMVRVYDEKKCRVADLLLDFVEVDDASAEGLDKSVKEMLEKEEIPLQNIVGFASDNCSTMLGTRWLSRGLVLSRILEQWDALQLFLQGEAKTDKVDGASQISKTMATPGTKHMLLFLNYIISKVAKLNLEFQSQYFRIATLYSTISDEYRSILALFVDEDILHSHSLAELDPNDAAKHKSIIGLGGRCEAMLIKQPLGEYEGRFRNDCKRFLVELCTQMKKRFNFKEDSILAMLSIMDPKKALSPQRGIKSIGKLAVNFPNLVKKEDLDELQDQWKDLLQFKESLKNISGMPATSFWLELKSIKDTNNQTKFHHLSTFMCNLMVLPHSSACVERVFSQLNRIKNKQTNKLQVSTVANCILAMQSISRQDGCHRWEPSPALIKDVKGEKCHKRYMEREASRKGGELATLYADEGDTDEIEEAMNVYLN